MLVLLFLLTTLSGPAGLPALHSLAPLFSRGFTVTSSTSLATLLVYWRHCNYYLFLITVPWVTWVCRLRWLAILLAFGTLQEYNQAAISSNILVR